MGTLERSVVAGAGGGGLNRRSAEGPLSSENTLGDTVTLDAYLYTVVQTHRVSPRGTARSGDDDVSPGVCLL